MQALSGNNFIQCLDVRTRMLVCFVCSLGIIFIKSWYPLTILLAASFIYVIAHGRLKIIGIAYGGVLLMFGIALVCIRIMLIFWPGLGEMGIAPFVNPFIRVMILVNVILALAIACSVQKVMTSLKSLYLPFFIYLPATVMIRFIPSFINDVKQIRESMKIKGFSLNIFFLTFHPLLSLRLLFVPVVIRALRSSDELSVAAELKGVGSGMMQTRLQVTRFGRADLFVVIYTLVLMGISLMSRMEGVR